MRLHWQGSLGAIVALALSTVIAPASAGNRSTPRPPNVILILADDLGYGDLGCYGQQHIRTPHLDRLAAEGMRFTQFYSGSPVCAPARCVLMTGKHPGRAPIRNNREIQPEGNEPLPASEVTLAERLKPLGYATACVGKWGLGPPDSEGHPNRQGFDYFFGYLCQRHAHNHYPTYLWRNGERVPLPGNPGGATGEQYSHDLFEAEALRFVREQRDRPFFLYLAFTVPHAALQVPEDSLAAYRGKWDDPPYTGGRGYFPHPAPRAAYAAMITRMDRSVGRLIALLRELGLAENSLVLVTSDNGPTHGGTGGTDSTFFRSAGSLRGLKGSVYEGGLRVPLIAWWPGRIRPGVTSEHVAAFWDVVPTVCEIAGAPAPSEGDGISLAPTLLGRGRQRRHRFLYWEFHGYGGQQAVRWGDWKAVRRDLHRGNLTIELYDLRHDPAEARDVVAEHPEVVRRIERMMAVSHTPSPIFPIPVLDGEPPRG